MNRNFMLLGAALLGASALPGAAMAADSSMTPYSKQVAVGAQDRVDITNVAGSLTISTWDKNEVDIQGELASGIERVDVTKDAGGLEIRVVVKEGMWNQDNWRDDSWRRGVANLKIRLPAGVRLEANTVSADLTVNGLKGKTRLKSVSGDIRSDVISPDFEAKSVSGDVELNGNGSPQARLRANSVSGDITLTKMGGQVDAKSVSGSVDVALMAADDSRVGSVSGDVEVTGSLGAQGDLDVQTVSGRAKVTAQSSGGYRYELNSFSGRIKSCLAGETEPRKNNRGGRMTGVLTQGSGDITIKSHSGNVELCDR